MQKTLIKRSTFLPLTLNTGTKSLELEADEVYVIGSAPGTENVLIRRQRERDLAKLKAENPTFTGGSTQEFLILAIANGRVNLDGPADADGKLTNKAVTTAANDLKQADRYNHQGVGFKEIVDFKSATEGSNASVIIELVNYVTADSIGV